MGKTGNINIIEHPLQGFHRWQGEIVINDRKIDSGVYAVHLSRNHVYRRIRSARTLMNERENKVKRFYLQTMTAALSLDDLNGIYCSRCLEMIHVGEDCYRKRMVKNRSSYYHADCAKIVHLI